MFREYFGVSGSFERKLFWPSREQWHPNLAPIDQRMRPMLEAVLNAEWVGPRVLFTGDSLGRDSAECSSSQLLYGAYRLLWSARDSDYLALAKQRPTIPQTVAGSEDALRRHYMYLSHLEGLEIALPSARLVWIDVKEVLAKACEHKAFWRRYTQVVDGMDLDSVTDRDFKTVKWGMRALVAAHAELPDTGDRKPVKYASLSQERQQPGCANCGAEDHWSRECPRAAVADPAAPADAPLELSPAGASGIPAVPASAPGSAIGPFDTDSMKKLVEEALESVLRKRYEERAASASGVKMGVMRVSEKSAAGSDSNATVLFDGGAGECCRERLDGDPQGRRILVEGVGGFETEAHCLDDGEVILPEGETICSGIRAIRSGYDHWWSDGDCLLAEGLTGEHRSFIAGYIRTHATRVVDLDTDGGGMPHITRADYQEMRPKLGLQTKLRTVET